MILKEVSLPFSELADIHRLAFQYSHFLKRGKMCDWRNDQSPGISKLMKPRSDLACAPACLVPVDQRSEENEQCPVIFVEN